MWDHPQRRLGSDGRTSHSVVVEPRTIHSSWQPRARHGRKVAVDVVGMVREIPRMGGRGTAFGRGLMAGTSTTCGDYLRAGAVEQFTANGSSTAVE